MMWVMRIAERIAAWPGRLMRRIGRRRRVRAFWEAVWRAAGEGALDEFAAPMRALMRKRRRGPWVIEAKDVRTEGPEGRVLGALPEGTVMLCHCAECGKFIKRLEPPAPSGTVVIIYSCCPECAGRLFCKGVVITSRGIGDLVEKEWLENEGK